MPGYSRPYATRPPEKIGEDEHGHIVKWFYPDATVTFKRFGDPWCYRVAEIYCHD